MKYTNPIILCNPDRHTNTRDPHVTLHNGYYYHCYSSSADGVYLAKSKELTDIGNGECMKVFDTQKEGVPNHWYAPELHFIDGDCYIYGAPDILDGKKTHSMRVLRLKGDDPMGTYEYLGAVEGIGDKWSIDATVMFLNGKRYLIYVSNHIWLSELVTPTKIAGESTAIVKAEYPWEMEMQPITEGPAVLKNGDDTYIVYSASDCRSDGYCMGVIKYMGGDPMDASNWKKHSEPILKSGNGVSGTGHCSFTTVNLDGKDEPFIVYHGNLNTGMGKHDASVFTQKVTYKDGLPYIGKPQIDCEY